MKAILPDSETQKLNTLIAKVEKGNNIQVVLAVVKRSDSYAEIPWKAFALGSMITGFLVFIACMRFYISGFFLLQITIPFFMGIIFLLASLLIHPFARFFLPKHRTDQEVKQYAQSLFLSKELFATEMRTGILIFISVFERKVFLLPDKRLQNQLSAEQLQEIMNPMIIQLKNKNLYASFETGLEKLVSVLEANGNSLISVTGKNDLPDEIIREGSI